jgi:hypothetical protein
MRPGSSGVSERAGASAISTTAAHVGRLVAGLVRPDVHVEILCLIDDRLASRSGLFNERRIVLRRPVHLGHGLVDLFDATPLPLRSPTQRPRSTIEETTSIPVPGSAYAQKPTTNPLTPRFLARGRVRRGEELLRAQRQETGWIRS